MLTGFIGQAFLPTTSPDHVGKQRVSHHCGPVVLLEIIHRAHAVGVCRADIPPGHLDPLKVFPAHDGIVVQPEGQVVRNDPPGINSPYFVVGRPPQESH